MRAPHLTSEPPSFAAAPAELLAQVADALAWPLLLLRRDASLMHANAAARQLLRRGQPLRLDQGRAVPVPAGQRPAFDAALQQARDERRLLHWPGAAGGMTVTLAALPAVTPAEAPVMVVLSGGDGRADDAQAYADLHGLTAAETRVLQRLALGESTRQAAAALGVGVATVRTQVMNLRRKTGHPSVPALLRSLAALPPLAAPT